MAQYVLHQKLGEGGYSSVYKCTDTIGIRYACKIMPKEKNKRIRVQQEIKIMKTMMKSNKIVHFIEAGEDLKNYYIIQELCRGGTVKDYMSGYKHFGENTVASLIRGVLRGLCHLHQEGIIHRDIKAGNVLLGDRSEDADVKLGDFGTSLTLYGDSEEINTIDLHGTPLCMPPESLSYKCHFKSDIWSVGVLAYYLLTGKFPFNDRENQFNPRISAIWRSILSHQPSFIESEWNLISDDAKTFIKTCLVKDFHGRPTARECLFHPWLTKTDVNDRFKGEPLAYTPFRYEEVPLMYAQSFDTELGRST
jgi:calcium-dependent protein kinase